MSTYSVYSLVAWQTVREELWIIFVVPAVAILSKKKQAWCVLAVGVN